MKRLLFAIGLAAALIPVLCASSLADVIRLKDGTRLEGEIRRTDEGWIITDRAGKKTLVAFDRVAGIEATPKGGGDVPEQRLASLRRAADNIADPRQAITRYQAFLKQYIGTSAAPKAQADLAIWQERLDKHLVKLGDKWVNAEEKSEIERESQAIAADALRLLAQSKLRDAAPIIDRALVENPRNAAAWYLKGVLHFRLDQIPLARKAFTEAQNLLPDHVPTMNNMAVILWRQNAQPAALTQYDKALLASPADRRILDNLAEALAALPEEQRNTTLTKKVVRHFNEQDLALQAKLKPQGLFRWGATWVTTAEMDKLQKAEQAIQAKLDAMSADFDALTTRIAQLDADISENEKAARRMEAQSVGMDASGRIVRYALPPTYYDIKRDIANLAAEKKQRLAQQEAMRKVAKQLRQQIIGGKYAGVQRLVDIEGTPLPGAAEVIAAAQPTGAARATTQPVLLPGEPPAPPAPARP